MEYKIYNKRRFLKEDEAVIDQQGNVLILDDGDAPNHINNSLDVDILKVTSRKDSSGKEIIQGDIIMSGGEIYIIDYYNDSFVIVELIQRNDGGSYYHYHNFGKTFDWLDEPIKIIANVCENNRMKRFYKTKTF